MILAIDPGTKCAGWSFWRNLQASGWRVFSCGLLRWGSTAELFETAKHKRLDLFGTRFAPLAVGVRVVCELPQVYSQRHWKGDPNDLIGVAVSAGLVIGALDFDDVEFVKPHAWKGNTPKPIHNKRVLAALGDGRKIYDDACKTIPASLHHNVVDAIGLGAWAAKKDR